MKAIQDGEKGFEVFDSPQSDPLSESAAEVVLALFKQYRDEAIANGILTRDAANWLPRDQWFKEPDNVLHYLRVQCDNPEGPTRAVFPGTPGSPDKGWQIFLKAYRKDPNSDKQRCGVTIAFTDKEIASFPVLRGKIRRAVFEFPILAETFPEGGAFPSPKV